MTPLHLEILLWYHTRGTDFEEVTTNETRRKYAYELAELGFLYTPDFGESHKFCITKYGKRVIEKLLEVMINENPLALI